MNQTDCAVDAVVIAKPSSLRLFTQSDGEDCRRLVISLLHGVENERCIGKIFLRCEVFREGFFDAGVLILLLSLFAFFEFRSFVVRPVSLWPGISVLSR
jgi:hypothetical protein